MIYRGRISAKQQNAVELLSGGKLPEPARLWYGYGRHAYVNLGDSLGMGRPVFTLPIR